MTVVRTAAQRRDAGVDWFDGKKTLKGVDDNVYELRYTHSCRVLVQQAKDALVIVDVGDHEVTTRYAALPPRIRLEAFQDRTQAPEWFLAPHPLFVEFDESRVAEQDPDSGWASFLSKDQSAVADALEEGVFDSIADGGVFTAYLRGGAGTGKTAVLLNVAIRLVDLGLSVDFSCSRALARYLLTHTGVDVHKMRGESTVADVLIIDDPGSPESVEQAVRLAGEFDRTAVVVGFDPLQWPRKSLHTQLLALPPADFDQTLRDCYRQAGQLASNAIGLISQVYERSSFRVAPERIRAEREALEELSAEYLEGMSFTRPGGRLAVRDCNMSDLESEARRLHERPDLWKDLPALLELEERAGGVKLTKAAKALRRGIKTQTEDLDDVAAYRGLDFQVVWIFITREFFDRVQKGVTGLKGPEWSRLLNLHIPMTRARDETVLFLVD